MCKLCSGEKNQVVEDGFYGCESLKEIPKNTVFKSEANFCDCTSLEEIHKGTIFKSWAHFRGCILLKKTPEGAVFKRGASFNGCTSLKKIAKSTVFEGGVYFEGCTSLKKIPGGTVFRAWVDFYGCESLRKIPEDTVFRGGADFRGCTSLKKIPKGTVFEGGTYLYDCISLDLNSLIKANMKTMIYISVDMGDKKEWEKQWRAIDKKLEYGLTVSIINKNTNGTVQFETLEQAIAFRKGELVGRKAFEIKNAELRMVVLQEVGFEEVIKDYNLELVDFSDAGKLWKSKAPIDEGVPGVEPQILAVFGGVDPAKGEMCYLRTNPEAQTADEGKLATFPLAWGVYKKTGEMPAFIYES